MLTVIRRQDYGSGIFTIILALIPLLQHGYYILVVYFGILLGAQVKYRRPQRRPPKLAQLPGRIYDLGEEKNESNVPFTQAKRRCSKWLNPSSLQRIPTPLNRC